MPEGFRPGGLRWCGSGAHEVLLLPHAWVQRMHDPVGQTGKMAPVGRAGVLQLLRGTGKQR